MYYNIIVLVIVALSPQLCIAQLGDYCRTPLSQQGECISLLNCDSLYNILKTRPISSSDADFLRRSQCGFLGTTPKVCCPTGPVGSTTTQAPINQGIQSDLLPTTDVCGTGTINRIYGGEKAQLDEFPWMALVEYERPNGQRGFYCGGVLISSRYVLTAAHCLKGKDLPPNWKIISVRLGEYNTDTEEDCITTQDGQTQCAPPAVDVAVDERVAHESYNPFDANQYHDIALLRLIRNVKFSDYVKPICLPQVPTLQSKSYVNKNLIVAGWGKTENSSESNIKLKLEVPVNTHETCSNTYSQANVRLGAGQLCAGGKKGRDSCRGDSGGPLMTMDATPDGEINWYSIGVVSFGPSPCGMQNWPGVYTKVANYVPWIVGKLKA
ncbi:serine protease easter-like [Euwallacea similis]|uniref:serine protease easter-like n=1 Tax=Euwallacea similis TaxID=1736056 RepID=UPI00344BEBEA